MIESLSAFGILVTSTDPERCPYLLRDARTGVQVLYRDRDDAEHHRRNGYWPAGCATRVVGVTLSVEVGL